MDLPQRRRAPSLPASSSRLRSANPPLLAVWVGTAIHRRGVTEDGRPRAGDSGKEGAQPLENLLDFIVA